MPFHAHRWVLGTLIAGALGFSMLPAHAQTNSSTSEPTSRGLPSLGDAGEVTTLQERKLGDAIARELYRDPDYLDDPVLGEYVDGIWRALLAGARARGELTPELDERFAWQLLMGRDRTINAFALPGGYFGLHAGLIGAVSSRDELASVLAHEMTHVAQRHLSRMFTKNSRNMPLMMAAMVLGAIAASKNPQAGTALMVGGQAAMAQQQLNFSRDMEREADRIGFGIMTQSGFAPQGFVSMFEKLQAASRINDNGDWPYLRSHPLTTQRIADMQQRVRNATHQSAAPTASAPSAAGSAADTAAKREAKPDLEALLLAARARVVGRPGVDVLRAWAAEPAQSGFDAQPLARRAAVLYAAALASAELRNLPQAQTLAAQLGKLVGTDAKADHQARLLQAELALQAKQPARALELLPAMAPRTTAGPGQAGRAVLLLRARALTESGQAAQAASSLQPWVSDHPRDAAAWQALAQAYAAQGLQLRALRAEGEVPMAHLDYAGAVDRWRAAQDYSRQHPGSNADRIEASIVDTRLRVAQAALKQEQDDEKNAQRR